MEREEEYLEAIYELQKSGKIAKTGELARILKVKPSSVTEMLLKLKNRGFVDYSPYRGVILTKSGEEIAERIKKHHQVATSFFKFLGIEDELAEKLGCELEHHMSDEVAKKLTTILLIGCGGCEREVKRLSCVSDGVYEVVSCPHGDLKPGDILIVVNGEVRKEDSSKVKEEVLDLVLVRKSL
ncbi:MAG: metal-dependent transcriptional regulator [Archaeoglobaceae archaeon]|nr:metal-dependent transcriptional regulator [Archaeoglobaceae archaeon]